MLWLAVAIVVGVQAGACFLILRKIEVAYTKISGWRWSGKRA